MHMGAYQHKAVRKASLLGTHQTLSADAHPDDLNLTLPWVCYKPSVHQCAQASPDLDQLCCHLHCETEICLRGIIDSFGPARHCGEVQVETFLASRVSKTGKQGYTHHSEQPAGINSKRIALFM